MLVVTRPSQRMRGLPLSWTPLFGQRRRRLSDGVGDVLVFRGELD
jgi:hypothetical protein